jgi:hypothetical protein
MSAMDSTPPPSDEGDFNGEAGHRQARRLQAGVERERLMRHQRIASILLAMSLKDHARAIDSARQVVQRWRDERLCSADYIDRWSEILEMPIPEMAAVMVSDPDGWGTALRQNSPWVGMGGE